MALMSRKVCKLCQYLIEMGTTFEFDYVKSDSDWNEHKYGFDRHKIKFGCVKSESDWNEHNYGFDLNNLNLGV